MIFEELNIEYVEKVVDPLIYFLIDVNNEVVYVGKTLHGYSRPFAHINDKVFEKIAVLKCNESELDYLEDKFIMKYQPKYNKQVSVCSRKSAAQIRQLFTNLSLIRGLKIDSLVSILSCVDIKCTYFKQSLYISIEDFNKLEKLITTLVNNYPDKYNRSTVHVSRKVEEQLIKDLEGIIKYNECN